FSCFFFSSRGRHTRSYGDWSSDVCSSDLRPGTVDVHGGWYDATGDYGKHLSHLDRSTYHNPQQTPLVVYALFEAHDRLARRHDEIGRASCRERVEGPGDGVAGKDAKRTGD